MKNVTNPCLQQGSSRYNLLQVNGLSATGRSRQEVRQRLVRDSREGVAVVVQLRTPSAFRHRDCTMVDKSKMTVAEMLAAARKADSQGGAPG